MTQRLDLMGGGRSDREIRASDEIPASAGEVWPALYHGEAPKAPGLQIMFRTYVERVDQGFVLANWSRHVRELHPFTSWPSATFNAHMHEQAKLVDRTSTLIVCAPDHPEQAFGFVVGRYVTTEAGELPVLDFCYVRKGWREKGMGKALMQHVFPCLAKAPIYHTHPARAISDPKINLRKRWQLVFNPYLARPHA